MKLIITFQLLLLLCHLHGNAQISGIVFRDFNNNGTRESSGTYTEPLVPGVVVNAYNAAEVLVASYTTNAGTGAFPYVPPNYNIPASGSAYNGVPGSNTGFVASGVAVRIEFVVSPAGLYLASNLYDFSAKAGGTSTQFINGGAFTVNYGINNPADYVFNTAPFNTTFLYASVQTNGNPLAGGASAAQNAFVKFPYNRSGNTALAASEILATNAQIGTTYGVAYSKYADRIFVSAYMKRHAGMGPANGVFNNAPGAIYIIDPTKRSTTGAAAYFTSLDALGIPTHNTTGTPAYGLGSSYTLSVTGTGISRAETISYMSGGVGVIGDNTTRALPADQNTESNDPAAYSQVGQVSLGDMEMSDDGQYLFVVNLYDSRIYQLQLNSITAPTAASVVTSWPLPNPPLRSASGLPGAAATYNGTNDNTDFYTGARGLQRPFGLKYYRGKLYVGAVTTAEGTLGSTTKDNNTGNPEYTDLWAYVWALNPATGFNTSPVLQFPLNFDRSVDGDLIDETWNPWSNTMPVPTGPYAAGGYYGLPQPVLAGIEFDVDGTMILGFRDRAGDQSGTDQFMLSSSGPNEARTVQANGDQLRAYRQPATGVFELEQNGKEGSSSPKPATAGAANTQGPANYTGSNGEFYYQDGIEKYNGANNGGTLYHHNTGMGSLALLPGNSFTAGTYMDANGLFTGGISWMNNTTSTNPRDYSIQYGGNAGDIGKSNGLGDLEMLVKIPAIEIGNRVWEDANGDGIQNAGETGLSGVEMELLNSSGTVIATVSTSASGTYYFSSAAGVSAAGIVFNVNIQPNTNYTVRVKGTVDASNFISGNAGLGSVLYFTTLSNVSGNGQPGFSDNDGVKAGSSYQASITTGAYGNNNHNIDFGVINIAFLPLRFIEFTAEPQNNAALLRWSVAGETGSTVYELQRSVNGVNFTGIATINSNAARNGSYSYTDNSMVPNVKNYYRVRQSDGAGHSSVSDIRWLRFNETVTLSLYPNPATETLNLMLGEALRNQPLQIEILSAEGRQVLSRQTGGSTGTLQLPVALLAPGIYQLRIRSNGEVKAMQSFVKQ
jgi:hypothetical protein